MVVVATIFNVLSTLFVVLRMISRMGILRKSSIDDYLIVSAVLFSWFHTGSVYARELATEITFDHAKLDDSEAHFGAGKHVQEVPFQDYGNLLLVSFPAKKGPFPVPLIS